MTINELLAMMHPRQERIALRALAALAICIVGCSESSAPACQPGTVMVCSCLGGAVGAQTCNADGSEYGACGCDAGVVDASVDAGLMDGGPRDATVVDATSPGDATVLDGGMDCGDLDAPGTWTSLGSFRATGATGTALSPALALAADDTPFIAFHQGGNVYVATRTSDAWSILSAPLSIYGGSTPAEFASIANESSGQPVVAWTETNPDPLVRGAQDVGVSHLDPDVWLPLGAPISAFPGDSSTSAPSLAIDPAGAIYVAFAEREQDAMPSVVHVRHWTGDSWNAVGTQRDRYPGTGGNAQLAVAPDETLFLAWWEQGPTISQALVERWSGSAWEPVGAPVSRTPSAATGEPAFALSNDGTPHIIVDGLVPGAGTLELFRWTGSEWESLGSPDLGIPGATSAGPGELAFDARNRPVVALQAHGTDEQIVVRRYDAGSWTTLAEIVATVTPPDENVSYPRIAVTRCGDPIVVWTQAASRSGPANIHAVRYER